MMSDIDPTLEPDHECGNRACVKVGPGHVVEVTKAVNMARMAERVRLRRLAEQEAYSQGTLTLEPDLADRLVAAHREQQAAA